MDTARPYTAADRAACLALFDSNAPRFFDPSERVGFEQFLDDLRWPYQVIERPDSEGGGRIVACGGHAVEPDGRTVSLCWGMVEQGLHGQGLGRLLTEARLAAARAEPGVTAVRLDTGQHTTGFYERFGFVIERVVKDGYAPGSDRHDMRLTL
ncbi:MAG: GNAT family N-acetyltransferase [Brevundimonas sp.]|nr:MAG: GNAT family N-acetyltransferase [Brevundimonas sp.]